MLLYGKCWDPTMQGSSLALLQDLKSPHFHEVVAYIYIYIYTYTHKCQTPLLRYPLLNIVGLIIRTWPTPYGGLGPERCLERAFEVW